VIADGIAAGQQKATPADFTPAKNGVPAEEEAMGTEGASEQAPAEEEPVADAPTAPEPAQEEVPAE